MLLAEPHVVSRLHIYDGNFNTLLYKYIIKTNFSIERVAFFECFVFCVQNSVLGPRLAHCWFPTTASWMSLAAFEGPLVALDQSGGV